MIKLGSLIIGRDEECTAAMTIKASLQHSDLCVYIDTGSADKTINVIKAVCNHELREGKLIIDQVDIGENLEIHKARNLGIKYLNENEMDWFIKLDADDILYPDTNFRYLIRELDPKDRSGVSAIWFPSHELYQYKAQNSYEWLENLHNSDGFFEMTDQVYGTLRLHRVFGCWAEGNWCDESRGKRPEGYRYHTENNIRANQYILAHYGWARPMDIQIKKAIMRYGDQNKWSPRVNQLHLEPFASQKQLRPFHRHPEVASRLARQIKSLI